MKVILFGGSGMVGQGVLRECLIDPGVESVLSVGRSPLGVQHPKLRELREQQERLAAGFQELARQRDLFAADRDTFDKARATFEAHKAAGGVGNVPVGVYRELLDEIGPVEFTGRQEHSTPGAKVRGLIVDGERVTSASGGDVQIVLDRTPFYAESGGQVGDTGTLRTDTGAATVLDTTYAVPGQLVRHVATITEGTIQVGQEVTSGLHLADCGNSGNATQPHVHVQVMDHRDPTVARGLPMTFRRFREWPRGASRFEVRESGLPAEGAVVEPLPVTATSPQDR